MATVNEKMTAIADAIREKTGETEPLTLDDMATDIPKVYDAGKKAQNDGFYEKFVQYGKGHRRFAGQGWNYYTFYPTKDISLNATGVFQYFSWQLDSDGVPNLDLAERLNECGVKLIDDNGVGDSTFNYAWVSRVPKLKASSSTSLIALYRGAQRLATIEGLELPEDNDFTFSNTFTECYALKDITIIGTIANSVSFSACSKLTSESVDSIIAALKILATDDGAKTLTLHATVKANMNDTQMAVIQEKGWTLA